MLLDASGRYKFEPICNLQDGQLACGYEILSTRQRDNWLEHDLATLRNLDSIVRGLPGLLSINLSTDSILHVPEALIEDAAAKHPGLVIEWTEDVSPRADMMAAATRLRRWRIEHGILISLDDMGRGQDCFDRFIRVQPEFGKIDGALLHGARKDRVYRSAMKAICNMCVEEGAKVVIEWIETQDDLLMAQDLGAELGQGFYFQKQARWATAQGV